MIDRFTLVDVALSGSPGSTSVGVSVSVEHTAASKVGARVVASAELTEVDGRRLVFAVRLRDGATTAATARVTRMVVDRERFLARL